MIYELINSFLYVIAFIVYRNKHKKFDAYSWILCCFMGTAICCLLYQMSGASPYKNTTLFPYFYFFACILILLKPFAGFEVKKELIVNETSVISILTWIYIITGIISIYYTLPNTINFFTQGNWNLIRQDLYDDQAVLYNSPFERLCKNIHGYLGPFGIVMCFYELSKKESWVKVVLLFTTWLGASFLDSTLVASRGIIANLILSIVLYVFLFNNSINKRIKRGLVIIAITLIIPLIWFIVIVSFSRFGEDGAGDSAFFYLGHSMQCFNESMMGKMHDYAYGKYAFHFFLPFFSISPDVDYAALGFKEISSFFTIVGSFYIDWGPIFTPIFCILLSLFLTYFTRKRVFRISKMIIIVYFSTFILNGIFVNPPGYGLGWLMTILLYFVLRITNN